MVGEHLKRLAQLAQERRFAEADVLALEALEAFPNHEGLQRARAIILRQANRAEEAEVFLAAVLETAPEAAWAHAQLGLVVQGQDGQRAIRHFRIAHQLDPHKHDYRLGLIHALGRWGDEGDDLEEAYQVLAPVLDQARGWGPNDLYIAYQVLKRVCAYDDLDRLGDPLELGRKWAASGNHTALFNLLSEGRDDESRAELMELHRQAAGNMARRVGS